MRRRAPSELSRWKRVLTCRKSAFSASTAAIVSLKRSSRLKVARRGLGGQAVDALAVPVLRRRQGLVVQGRDDGQVVAQGARLLAQAILVALDPAQGEGGRTP